MLSKIRSLNSMESIREELSKCKKSELLAIADELQLTGVKSWSKAKLVDWIAETQSHRIESQILASVDIKSAWQRG